MVKRGAKVWKALLPRPREEKDDPVLDQEAVNEKVIEAVCEGLGKGQIGILPTETVYGLVGSAQADAVIDRIYEAKGRQREKSLPVQVSKFSDVAGLGVAINAQAETLARNFWPGPLTLVLPFLGADKCRWNIAPKLLAQWAEIKTVAVRIPDHPVAQMVLKRVGMPVVATSANVSGEEPITRLSQLDETLRGKVDWIVDGGPTVFGRESSVVLCDAEGWRILREGALRAVLIAKAFSASSKLA